MNLHEVCLFVLKDLPAKKGRISAEEEFSLIGKLFPEKIRRKFPTIFGIGTTSFNEKQLRNFMLQGNGSGNALMAVSSYFQANPSVTGQLLERCGIYLKKELENIRPGVFGVFCDSWLKSLKLGSDTPLYHFLCAARKQNPDSCPEFLAFIILSACSLDNEMLLLLYDSYAKYLADTARRRRIKPLQDLIFNYCMLYNVCADCLDLDYRIRIEPHSSYSFTAFGVNVREEALELSPGQNAEPESFQGRKDSAHKNASGAKKNSIEVKYKNAGKAGSAEKNIPAENHFNIESEESKAALKLLEQELENTDSLYFGSSPSFPSSIQNRTEQIFTALTFIAHDLKQNRADDLRVDMELLRENILELAVKYCQVSPL